MIPMVHLSGHWMREVRVWEGKESYQTLDEAMQDLEKALTEWVEENE